MSKRGDRRQFGKQVAAITAGAFAAGAAGAQAAQPKPEARAATLQALVDIVRARHGGHLSDEQLQHVRRKIAGNLLMADALKRTPLNNGDEPDFTFSAE